MPRLRFRTIWVEKWTLCHRQRFSIIASYLPIKDKSWKNARVWQKKRDFWLEFGYSTNGRVLALCAPDNISGRTISSIHAEGASMKRIARFATAVSLIIVGMTCERAGAVNPVNTVKWVGAASGQWNDANAWKNTTTNVTANSSNAAIFEQGNGSDGMNTVDPATTR